MAYLPPAAHAAAALSGVFAGNAAAPEPRELIGFAASAPDDTRRRLTALVAALRAAESHATEVHADYPASHHGDYAEMLATLTDVDEDEPALTGEAPDPSAAAPAVLGLERAVVDFCTDLALGDRRHTYGYVTAGASEGLLVGLRAAHEALPGAPLYVSAAAHHAVRGHAAQLGAEVVEVPCGPDGTMDADALRLLAARRPGGAVVLVTIGSAATGTVDDLAATRAAARAAGPVHVHVDATRTGLLAPFAPSPVTWDLRDGADSLSLTAHRLLGLPVPCGVVLARSGEGAPPARALGSTPHPLAVALLWAALRGRGYAGLRSLVHECYDTARYAADHLTEAGYRATRTGDGLSVRFPRPAAAVCERWRLSTEGPYARLTALPPLTRAAVDALCRDLYAGGPLPTVPVPRSASAAVDPQAARAAR